MLYPTELRGRDRGYITAQATAQSARGKPEINDFIYCLRTGFSAGESRST
jgi:hypothetical protein